MSKAEFMNNRIGIGIYGTMQKTMNKGENLSGF